MRFQCDLIDFNKNPQEDIDGVVRRWVLVVKDHFTKYAWCRPLRKKTSKLVKHELLKLLNEVGWPLIFHTDNGSEFVARVITELIRDHPFICSVTGRTRIPSDQGSVERLNQEIKKIIDQIILEQHLKGNTGFTWLDALPFVTEAINKTFGFGVGKLAPYTHVYGIDYKCPVGPPIPESDKKLIHTVHDLANYSEVHNLKPLLKQAGYDVDKQVQLKLGDGELEDSDDESLCSDPSSHKEPDPIAALKEPDPTKIPCGITITMPKNNELCNPQLPSLPFGVDEISAKRRKANDTTFSPKRSYDDDFQLDDVDDALDEKHGVVDLCPTVENRPLFNETEGDDESERSTMKKMMLADVDEKSKPTEICVDGSVGLNNELEMDKIEMEANKDDDNSSTIEVFDGKDMKKKPKKPITIGDFELTNENTFITVKEALKSSTWKGSHPHHLSFSHKYVIAEHSCTVCQNSNEYGCANIFENSYYHGYHLDRSRWFELNTIQVFIAMVHHSVHNPSIKIISSSFGPEKDLVLEKEVNSVLSLIWKGNHWAVCEFVLSSRKLNLYDGMFPQLTYWKSVTLQLQRRIDNALRNRDGYKVKSYKNGKEKPLKRFKASFCSRKWGHPVIQTDGWNCGPIAGMILWGIVIECDKSKFADFILKFKKPVLGYRDAIINEFNSLLAQYPNHWKVNKEVPVMREKRIAGFGYIDVSETEHQQKTLLSDHNKKIERDTLNLCRSCGEIVFNGELVQVKPCHHVFCDECWSFHTQKDECWYCTGKVEFVLKNMVDAHKQDITPELKPINIVETEKNEIVDNSEVSNEVKPMSPCAKKNSHKYQKRQYSKKNSGKAK